MMLSTLLVGVTEAFVDQAEIDTGKCGLHDRVIPV
jgi:hypothetical protein